MIIDVTEGRRRKAPLSTIERLKRAKEVKDKFFYARSAPEQANIKLEDIPF
jgi:hypothetical protein